MKKIVSYFKNGDFSLKDEPIEDNQRRLNSEIQEIVVEAY